MVAGGIALLAGVVAGVALMALRRLQREMDGQHTQVRALQQDLRALCNAAVTVGERIARIEQEVKRQAARQNELGAMKERLESLDADERSFAQAVKLARKGAGTDELMDICGLSRGEAELIAMMQRLKTGSHSSGSVR